VERAEEPLSVIESFFSRSDLPAHVAAWRGAAQASALMLCGLMHARSGRYREALLRFGGAIVAHPPSIASLRVCSLAVNMLRRRGRRFA
jgi:hypothetical protein